MTPLSNEFGITVAFLHKKMLIDLSGKYVLGLVVGNCVFGNQADPIGKIFNNILRDTNGSIVAKLEPENKTKLTVDETMLMNATWELLMKVKTHVCPWIPEMHTWSERSLTEVLMASDKVLEMA